MCFPNSLDADAHQLKQLVRLFGHVSMKGRLKARAAQRSCNCPNALRGKRVNNVKVAFNSSDHIAHPYVSFSDRW